MMVAALAPYDRADHPRHRLKLFDAPIQRIAAHRFKQFGGGVHGSIVLPVASLVKLALFLESLNGIVVPKVGTGVSWK